MMLFEQESIFWMVYEMIGSLIACWMTIIAIVVALRAIESTCTRIKMAPIIIPGCCIVGILLGLFWPLMSFLVVLDILKNKRKYV